MAGQSVAFRVDASLEIGTGHFMRCLTLADALKLRGAHLRFVSRHLPAYLRDLLTDKGYEYRLLPDPSQPVTVDELPHAHWLGASQMHDAQDCAVLLRDRNWDWLVVDHYALDQRWESASRHVAAKILVIDDIADRQHDCDALLDHNFYLDMYTRYVGKAPSHCQLLLGPRYALLRDEFRATRAELKPRTGAVKRVLLFFGGVDAANFTGRAIEALVRAAHPGLNVDVVVGTQHPFRAQVESECARHGFLCHVQTDQMARLMARADLGIGAGGTATWERCCLGLPTLAFGVAENQYQMVEDLTQAAYLFGYPDGSGVSQSDLASLLQVALKNGPMRRGMSERAMELVDGAGALRVARHLLTNAFIFRQATLIDTELIHSWRNHPDIRSKAHHIGHIDAATHGAWVQATLADPSRHLLIAEIDGAPVGVVRFDVRASDALISVYLSPDHLHQGMGVPLLRQATDWLRNAKIPVKQIVAEVNADNISSLASFAKAGYLNQSHIFKLDLEQA